jgi:hypothetical protein
MADDNANTPQQSHPTPSPQAWRSAVSGRRPGRGPSTGRHREVDQRGAYGGERGRSVSKDTRQQGDTWTWQGEATRTTTVFTDGGKIQTAHHERLDERGNRVPSMEVTLTRVE